LVKACLPDFLLQTHLDSWYTLQNTYSPTFRCMH
jgi:hypothetical protein